MVAVGNGAQLGVAQVAEALLASDQVSAIGMIVESLADLRGRGGSGWPCVHGNAGSVWSR